MDWLYLFYFLLGGLLCWGASACRRGEWQEDPVAPAQTRALKGAAALGVALHHIAQKTCAPWQPRQYIVHGLDAFLDAGYILVAVFFFCSGLGLYRRLRERQDYLKGFVRRRMLPVAAAYYLSEVLHLIIRLLMGQRMRGADILWYLTGLRMANVNAWFLVVIFLFYLFFYLAFRCCRREGSAIAWVFAGVLLYTAGCALVDHQDVWWVRGEWWYNSVLLFPLGLLFGKHEKRFFAFFRRGYAAYLPLSAAAVYGSLRLASLALNRWGYYGETWRDPLKVAHRLGCAGAQWLACAAVIWCCLLLMMKCRMGNAALRGLGGLSLDFYLCHGIFVELFGFSFLDTAPSLHYIRNVPLYLLAVLGCGLAAAVLFGALRVRVLRLLRLSPPAGREGRGRAALAWLRKKTGRGLLPGLVLLLALGMTLAPSLRRPADSMEMNGVQIRFPEGFACESRSGDYAVWTREGNAGSLIVSGRIRDENAQVLTTAEEVLSSCTWLRDAELYVNPQGIRMVRGRSMEYGGGAERRYYVETPGAMLMLSMHENERPGSAFGCEQLLLQTADSVCLPGGRQR